MYLCIINLIDMLHKKISGGIISIIALIISLIVFVILITLFFRIETIGSRTDYTALLVGSLSLIVTVLVGFQIANIVQLDKRFESLEKRTDLAIKKSLDEQRQLANDTAKKAEYDAIGTALMMLAWSFIEKNEVDDALRTLINSLRAFQQGDLCDPNIVNEMHDVEDLLISISESDKNNWAFRNIDEKNVFIDTAMKIQDKKRMNKLLDFFYRFRILESLHHD